MPDNNFARIIRIRTKDVRQRIFQLLNQKKKRPDHKTAMEQDKKNHQHQK